MQLCARLKSRGILVLTKLCFVQVELTKEIKARVSVLDKKGKPLRAAYYRLMNLTPIPGSDIISLRPDDKKPADGTWMQYIVHGASLGRTTLQFTAHPPGSKTIHSQRRDIQVRTHAWRISTRACRIWRRADPFVTSRRAAPVMTSLLMVSGFPASASGTEKHHHSGWIAVPSKLPIDVREELSCEFFGIFARVPDVL